MSLHRFFHLITKVWWGGPLPRAAVLFVHGRWTGTHTSLLPRCGAHPTGYWKVLWKNCMKMDSRCVFVWKENAIFFHCWGRGLLMHCVINFALRLPRMWAAPPMPGWCSVWRPLMPLFWPWTLQPSYQEAQTVSLTQLLTEQLVEETV